MEVCRHFCSELFSCVKQHCISITFLLIIFAHFGFAFFTYQRSGWEDSKYLSAPQNKVSHKNFLKLFKACKNYPFDWARYSWRNNLPKSCIEAPADQCCCRRGTVCPGSTQASGNSRVTGKSELYPQFHSSNHLRNVPGCFRVYVRFEPLQTVVHWHDSFCM